MLNKIWFALLLIGLLYGLGRGLCGDPATIVQDAPSAGQAANGTPPPAEPTRQQAFTAMGRKLTTAGIDAAKASVEICLGLIGVMALWLGLMRVAQDAGLIDLLARMLRPALRLLFPDVPRDHPAGGAIIMNLAANILGLDNAATPLGLKAMRELQTLNPAPDTATNSMAMFLAINTSSITLIPFTIIGYRAAAHSTDPASVVVPMTLATICSTLTAIIACRFLQRFYPPPLADLTGSPSRVEPSPAGEKGHESTGEVSR